MIRNIIIILCLSFTTMADAAIGCMIKSYRTYHWYREYDTCRPLDFKQLEYVACSCPCYRYPHDPIFGKCIQCWHYRLPINDLQEPFRPTEVVIAIPRDA